MDRSRLETDTFYLLPDGMVFITPDGFGGWWYDSIEGARFNHGDCKVVNIEEIPDY